MTIHGFSILVLFLRNGLNGRDQSSKLSNSHRGDMPYYKPSASQLGIVSGECWDKGRAAKLAFSFGDGMCIGFPFVNQAAPMARVNLVPRQPYVPSQMIYVHLYRAINEQTH